MKYSDGEEIELGDVIEVSDDRYAPERATVAKISPRSRKLYVEWESGGTPPREWVAINRCSMISRG